MNEKRGGGGSRRWLFLLIPATVVMAKAMHRRRMMGEQGWGPGAWASGRRGHHGWVGAARAEGDPTSEFRLPPKIESMLGRWHDRAHQPADSAESPTA
jgi:hypothetical protein